MSAKNRLVCQSAVFPDLTRDIKLMPDKMDEMSLVVSSGNILASAAGAATFLAVELSRWLANDRQHLALSATRRLFRVGTDIGRIKRALRQATYGMLGEPPRHLRSSLA